MFAIRLLLVIFSLIIGIYTCLVMWGHGVNFIPTVIQNISSLGWSGQFDIDLLMYLTLSGVWVAWRHRFSPLGIVLGLICGIGGMFFFAPYLLYMSIQSKGHMAKFLLGAERAQGV